MICFIRAMLEAGERMLYFINEKKLAEFEAWNNSSVLLVNAAKVEFYLKHEFLLWLS